MLPVRPVIVLMLSPPLALFTPPKPLLLSPCPAPRPPRPCPPRPPLPPHCRLQECHTYIVWAGPIGHVHLRRLIVHEDAHCLVVYVGVVIRPEQKVISQLLLELSVLLLVGC